MFEIFLMPHLLGKHIQLKCMAKRSDFELCLKKKYYRNFSVGEYFMDWFYRYL